MRVYIPFDDGSALSYDGERFMLHRCPVEIDADLSALSEGKAAVAWKERRREFVNALESAWFGEKARKRRGESRRVYKPWDKGSVVTP